MYIGWPVLNETDYINIKEIMLKVQILDKTLNNALSAIQVLSVINAGLGTLNIQNNTKTYTNPAKTR